MPGLVTRTVHSLWLRDGWVGDAVEVRKEGWGQLFNLHSFYWFDHKQLISMVQLSCSGGRKDNTVLYMHTSPRSGFPLPTILTSYSCIIVIEEAHCGNFVPLVPQNFPLQNSVVSLVSFSFADKFGSKISISWSNIQCVWKGFNAPRSWNISIT